MVILPEGLIRSVEEKRKKIKEASERELTSILANGKRKKNEPGRDDGIAFRENINLNKDGLRRSRRSKIDG